VSVVAFMVLGCSSSKKANTQVPTSTGPATTTATTSGATTPATTAQAPATSAATAGLSGTWSGQYSGVYQGTFTLMWQQAGSNLSGSIKLSLPPATVGINGTVQGNAIHFGTVGGSAVTYTGSVSGNSMSGTYQAPTGNGTWSASKAS
jgi:hypothetical protein